jgi:uroporphyrinogen decarboxylase
LTATSLCARAEPPSPIEKPIKQLAADWPKYRWLITMPTGVDTAQLEEMRAACRQRDQAFGVCLGYPGFQAWMNAVKGGVEQLAYALVDQPELLDEWHERDLERGTRAVELAIAAKPDYILWGGSGTITLASPELARRYAIPALKRWSAMTRAAGIPSLLHSCGKSRVLVDLLADETDVDCVNPLEIAPMGDVELAEVKRARGRQIALMGNLHTTKTMLFGTVADVRRAAVNAMRDAGQGGGFILSSGDQCPRDTPDANLHALLDVVREYGVYDRATGLLPRLPAE